MEVCLSIGTGWCVSDLHDVCPSRGSTWSSDCLPCVTLSTIRGMLQELADAMWNDGNPADAPRLQERLDALWVTLSPKDLKHAERIATRISLMSGRL